MRGIFGHRQTHLARSYGGDGPRTAHASHLRRPPARAHPGGRAGAGLRLGVRLRHLVLHHSSAVLPLAQGKEDARPARIQPERYEGVICIVQNRVVHSLFTLSYFFKFTHPVGIPVRTSGILACNICRLYLMSNEILQGACSSM